MPRPLPLHGRLECRITDFATWQRKAFRDGRVDEREAMELVGIVRPAMMDIRTLVKTQKFVATVIGGTEGINSPTATRTWDEIQAERAWTVGDDDDTNPEPPAGMARAA